MTPFARRIGSFIAAENLLTPCSKVLVGLSGGADSAALLAVLRELGHECVAVHCHFGLRGNEADRDRDHSRCLALRFDAKFIEQKFDTRAYMRKNNLSLEMACRQLRYDAFARIARAEGCNAIAVGHHREDNIETLFLNLLRGCGIHGVRAMEPKRDNIVRPLLETSKQELLDYLEGVGVDYVNDSSNFVADVPRNRLRLEVLPTLRRAFPSADEMLSKSLSNLRGCEHLFNSLLPPPSNSLDGVSSTLLHEWLAPLGFNSSQCNDILSASPGALFRSRDYILTVCPGRKFELALREHAPVRPELCGRIIPRPQNFIPRPGVLYLDAKAAEAAHWQLRLWREGDRMIPFGMNGSRLVADILADAGVNASRRRQAWVLTRNGDILWTVGIRASALFPITENSTEIIEITCHEEI